MVELKKKKKEHTFGEFEQKITKNKDRLLNNWNNEEFGIFNEENWNRTIELIKNVLMNLWSDTIDISVPDVLPLPEGTFDIHWTEETFHLTITIPSALNMSADIYGQKWGYPEHEIEALIHYDLVETVLISWLKKIL